MDLRFAGTALLALVCAPQFAFAFLPASQRIYKPSTCTHNPPRVSGMRDIEAESAQLQNIAEFGDSDRKTLDKYATAHKESASSVEQRYSASGDIICGKNFAQAQLVVRGDTVLTSAHAIFSPNTCDPAINANGIPIASAKDCKVIFVRNGVREEIPVERPISSGFKCFDDKMQIIVNQEKQRNEDDWIVLKLQRSASSKIKPYQFNKGTSIPLGNAVAIGKSQDFRVVVNGKVTHPRHYGDCNILTNVWDDGSTDELGTDCDSSQGNSGGALVAVGTGIPPILLGIHQSSSETPEMIADANSHNRINTGDYNKTKWNSVYLPITGNLQSALQNLEGTSSTSQNGNEI